MNKTQKHIRVFITLCTAILTASSLQMQSENPTPAPTKTPQSSTITPTETPSTDNTLSRSRTFTQADLNIITGNVQRPNGIIWFTNNLYVVCTGDKTIYEIDDTTGSTETYIFGTRNGHTLHAEQDSNQVLTLWVPDFESNQLLQVNSARTPQPIASQLQGPWGIVPLDAESFLITGFNGNLLYHIDREGKTQIILDELRSPTGITIDDENVYFANSGSSRRAIEWFSLDELPANDTGTPEISPKPLVSGLQNTTGVVMASDDKLYFAYSLGTRGVVGRVDPKECAEKGGCTNDEVEIILYTELAAPLAGLTISPDLRLFIHTMFRPEIYWLQLDK